MSIWIISVLYIITILYLVRDARKSAEEESDKWLALLEEKQEAWKDLIEESTDKWEADMNKLAPFMLSFEEQEVTANAFIVYMDCAPDYEKAAMAAIIARWGNAMDQDEVKAYIKELKNDL